MSHNIKLKYGCNPHQTAATLEVPSENTLQILNGNPSFINVLDALHGWQLAREISAGSGLAAATSFKHVSPAGAAVEGAISPEQLEACDRAEHPASPIANAYLRARNADPKSSFGDFVAVSEPVDMALASLLKTVVSDGIIAPDFEQGVLPVLASKKGGQYLVLKIDPDYEPAPREDRTVFGFKLTQDRNSRRLRPDDVSLPESGDLTKSAALDLLVACSAAKYTQSNSVVCAVDGQTVGVGAGQQSRIDCTRIACRKADIWRLRHHPSIRSMRFKAGVKRQERINWRIRVAEGGLHAAEVAGLESVLDQDIPKPLDERTTTAWRRTFPPLSLASDGYVPFADNVWEAHRHHVGFLAHPGGSLRDSQVADACRELGITLVNTGVRLFHH